MKKCLNCGYSAPDESVYCPMCCYTEFEASTPPQKKFGRIVSFFKGLIYPISFLVSSYASVYILAIVLAIAAALLEVFVYDNGFAESFINEVQNKTYLISMIANLMFIGALILFFAIRRKRICHELGFRKFPLYLAPLCSVLGYSMQYVLNIFIVIIPWPDAFIEHFESVYSSAEDTSGLLITILSVSVVTGITEELAFRSLPMSRLGRAFGPVFSIIFTSIIFGLAHMTPIAIFYASLLGVLMGIVYHKYKSVWPCAIIHMFFNLASVIGLPSVAPTFIIALYFISFGLAILTSYFIFKGSAADKA